MPRCLTAVLFLLLSSCAAPAQETSLPGNHDAWTAAHQAVQEAVDAVYAVSSFETVEEARAEDFTAPFTPDARLAFLRDGTLNVLSVREYAAQRELMLDSGEIQRLVEWEIAGHTEVFGNIAHRISSYGVYVNSPDSVAERGVMSFQLMQVDGQWRVHSLIWDFETEDRPLTPRLLPPAGSTD